jgi:hypothetical protein
VDGAGATVPASGAAGFVAALAAFLLGFAFFLADFSPAALFFAGFFNDFFLAFGALFFFFFFAAFLAFLFFAMTNLRQELMEQHTEPAHGGADYSTAGEKPRPIEFLCCLGRPQILIQDVRIELDPAVPYDRRRLSVHDDATEPVYIPPGAEGAHFEKIPEKNAPLQPVVELQPERVVP